MKGMYARCATQQVWRALVAVAAAAFVSYVTLCEHFLYLTGEKCRLPAATITQTARRCVSTIEMFLTLYLLFHCGTVIWRDHGSLSICSKVTNNILHEFLYRAK